MRTYTAREIADELGVEPHRARYALRILRQANQVIGNKRGSTIIYSAGALAKVRRFMNSD